MPLSIRARLFTAALAAPLLALPGPADAAESYDNCAGTITSLPATITTQGVWCLKSDLATAVTSGKAIEIDTNNVTIDCNGFKLGGLAAGLATQTLGISANSRLNATIRNCNIRGFQYGIVLQGGGGHVVEDNRLDGNTATGILTSGDGVTIRRNQVVDTGGGSTFSKHGISASGFAHVIDNTVSGVHGGEDDIAIGILQASPGTVLRNRVSGVVGGPTFDTGIYVNSNYGLVDDNYIYGEVGQTQRGIYCTNASTTARDNVIAETVTGVTNCQSVDNVVQL